MHRKPLVISPLPILLALILLCSVFSIPAFAEIVTIQKSYTYKAGEADSKISCRMIAIEQVKRQLLDELGTYLETETEVSGFQLTKDNIVVITAGIVKVDVIEEDWDGFVYSLKAQVTADTDDIAKSIEALRHDRQKIKELEETRRRADELLAEVERLKKDLETAKAERWEHDQQEYVQAISELGAIDSFERGYSSSLSGNYADAIMAFTTSIILYPQFLAAYNNRGVAYAKTGHYNLAFDDYNKVLKLNPNYASAYYNRGIAHFNLGNYIKAVKDYGRAISINPEYAEAYAKRGKTLSYSGNHKQALSDFDNAIKINPSNVEHYKNRGDAYYRAGNHTMATNDYKKISKPLVPSAGQLNSQKINNLQSHASRIPVSPHASSLPHAASYPKVVSVHNVSRSGIPPLAPNVRTHTRVLPSVRVPPSSANAPLTRLSSPPSVSSKSTVFSQRRVSPSPGVSSTTDRPSSSGISTSFHTTSARTFGGHSGHQSTGSAYSRGISSFFSGYGSQRMSHSPRGSFGRR